MDIGSKDMSDREFMILGKLFLTFGCLLGLPIWELWKLKRDRAAPVRETREKEKEADDRRASVSFPSERNRH
jgi:hypothetical protein